ncbi:MAG: hypothetical protein FWE03_02645 [Firmicutes bacterium]|nr:hypothetical protein [Bacillota bacterium]
MKTIKCYGKINLSLNILGLREDGYHFIDSIMMGVDLYDLVTAKKRNDEKIEIEFIGDGAETIEYNNTVRKAVELLKREYGEFRGVDIVIDKGLSIGGGLGGSAASAAGALKAVGELYGLFFGEERFIELCRKLGSDAAFMGMLIERGYKFCARVRGVGEVIEEIENNLKMDILIERGRGGASGDVYKAFDGLYRNGVFAPSDNDLLAEFLKAGDKRAVDYMNNGLESASILLCKEIRGRIDALKNMSTIKVMVAGSGGSVWGIRE